MENIILISIDCFRHDRCGYNGHFRSTTPFLDQIAGESVVFDNAYATGPFTTESVPGFIAGQHSFNGCYFNSHAWKAIPEGSETIASYLKKQGFETVAVLSNPHLTRKRNFDIGFDHFSNLETEGSDPKEKTDETRQKFSIEEYSHAIKTRMRRYNSIYTPYSLPYVLNRYRQYRHEWPTHRAEYILEKFADEIKSTTGSFFGWTHLMDLHAPIHPDVGENSAMSNILADMERVVGVDPKEYTRLYDSALAYVDLQLSNFVDELKSAKIWEETALIITADHGECLFDRKRMYGHPRHHHFDELLHVPLIVRTPHHSPERIRHSVSLAWLHEILSELVSGSLGCFPTNSGSNGLLSGHPGDEPVISDTVDENGHTIAVRNQTWKYLLHNVSPPTDFWYPFGEKEQSFRYCTDRGERNPVSVDTVEKLKTVAENVLVKPSELSSIEGEFTEEMENQLKDLGYMME